MFKFISELLFDILFFYTGEILLFIVTFGHKKPRWDYYTNERGSKFVIFSELSEWIGILFWFSVAFLIVKFILNK